MLQPGDKPGSTHRGPEHRVCQFVAFMEVDLILPRAVK